MQAATKRIAATNNITTRLQRMNTDTRALIDINVRVSPTLARRIRKAALAEEQGQDIRGCLTIAAGYGPEELDGQPDSFCRPTMSGRIPAEDTNEHQKDQVTWLPLPAGS